MLLMIDNYDSFTFNLVHYFQALGQQVKVVRNDQFALSDIEQLAPDYLVISPGPCTPDSAGLSLKVIEQYAGKIPLLGVCLGHQSIAQQFGANIVKARYPMHGKTSDICHNDQGLFAGLAQPLTVTRYHSLVIEPDSLPVEFDVTAWTQTADGELDEIMAIEHKHLPLVGVQFHPESIKTAQGHDLLQNFLTRFAS